MFKVIHLQQLEENQQNLTSDSSSQSVRLSKLVPQYSMPKIQCKLELDQNDNLCINQYKITKFIGCGGQSIVIQAINQITQQLVVLKIIDKKYLSKNHLEIYNKLTNFDHVEQFIEYFTDINTNEIKRSQVKEYQKCLFDENQAILVIQYYNMRSLQARPLDYEHQLYYFKQVAKTLKRLHTVGIYHCDIKPDNIITDGDKDFRLIDFMTALQPSGEVIKTQDFLKRGNTITNYIVNSTAGFSSIQYDITNKLCRLPQYDIYGFGCTIFYILMKEKLNQKEQFTIHSHQFQQLLKTKGILMSTLIYQMLQIDNQIRADIDYVINHPVFDYYDSPYKEQVKLAKQYNIRHSIIYHHTRVKSFYNLSYLNQHYKLLDDQQTVISKQSLQRHKIYKGFYDNNVLIITNKSPFKRYWDLDQIIYKQLRLISRYNYTNLVEKLEELYIQGSKNNYCYISSSSSSISQDKIKVESIIYADDNTIIKSPRSISKSLIYNIQKQDSNFTISYSTKQNQSNQMQRENYLIKDELDEFGFNQYTINCIYSDSISNNSFSQ